MQSIVDSKGSTGPADGASAVVIDSRYRVVGRLGSGRSSQVYEVEDLTEGTRKALKLLKLEGRADYLRFKSEFLRLRGLRHPNLVQVHDFSRLDATRAYFTCEKLFAYDARVNRWGCDEPGFVRLARSILEALAYLHGTGCLHLDVKSANVLFGEPGNPETAKLLDFGFAPERGSADRTRAGTLEYMAPEMIFEGRADARADLYSAGVTLYEAWTGATPFAAHDAEGIVQAKAARSSVVRLLPDGAMPANLTAWLEKLVHPEAIYRFSSARLAIEGLRALASSAFVAELAAAGTPELVRPLHPAFTGRDTELAFLLARYEALARNGASCCVVVEGAEGAGKTRLLAEFKSRAQVQGARVSTASCEHAFEDPFGAIVVLLRLLARGARPLAESVTAILPAEIFALVPEIGTGPTSPGEISTSEITLFEGIRRLLDSLTRNAAHVLVLEDVDRAGEPLRRLLRFLLRSMRQSRFLLVLSRDPAGLAEDACGEAADGAPAFPTDAVVRLQPLSAAETCSLACSALGISTAPDAFQRWIFEDSGGIPGRGLRGLEALTRDGAIHRSHGILNIEVAGFDFSSLSWSDSADTDSLALALDSLSPAVAAVLEAASVLGETFTLEALDRLLGADGDALAGSLEEAWHSRLVRAEPASPERLRFASGDVRRRLYKQLDPAALKRYHRCAARILEDLGAEPADIALHAEAGGDRPRAYRWTMEAGGRAVSALAFHRARRLYGKAVALCGTGKRWAALQADALEAEASMLERMGALREAAASYDRVARIRFRRGRDASMCVSAPALELTRKLSWCWIRLSETDRAEALLREVLDQSREKSVVRARLVHNLALLRMQKARYAEAVELAEQALLQLHEAGGDPGFEALFRSTAATALYRMGRMADSLEHNRLSLESARASRDRRREVQALDLSGCLHCAAGDNARAAQTFHQLMECLTETGDLSGLCTAYINLGHTAHRMGNWEAALEYQRKALSIAEQTDDRREEALTLTHLGVLHRDRGEYDLAERCLQRGLAVAGAIQNANVAAVIEGTLGDIALRRRDFKTAFDHFHRDLDLAVIHKLNAEMAEVYRRLAELEVAAGSPHKAFPRFAKAVEILARHPSDQEMGVLKRVIALAQAAMGQPAGARKSLAESIRRLRKTGNAYELSRTFLVGAGLLLESKRFRDAERWVRRAASRFERIAALADLEQAREIERRIAHERSRQAKPRTAGSS